MNEERQPRRPREGRTSARAASLDRSAQKRHAVMLASTQLFLEQGYDGTSMDNIASLAGVSKPTVYNHFPDKESLFVAIVLDTLDGTGDPFRARLAELARTENLAQDLEGIARWYISTVLSPEVLRLRRLVIGEAGRRPQLAETYYERSVERTLTALAACFERLAHRGLLEIKDPQVAAGHFAFLVLGRMLDRALFSPLATFPEETINGQARTGVNAFLRAYAKKPL